MAPGIEEDPQAPQPVEESEVVGDVQDEKRTRKDRPTGSIHFGDEDFDVMDEYGDATWNEVFSTCCVHTPQEWGVALGYFFLICFFLYWFLFGLELLGGGAKVMSGCRAGELFGDDTNPIAGLMIGIMVTVLLQSSSTTTSIIVSLIGPIISVRQGIYMVMGANIGTSVTNTIVAMGQMGDGDQLERAFAGATVHDMFNFMTVAILLPVEVVTHYLDHLTEAMTPSSTNEGEKWEGPVKKIVSPLAAKVIKSNKDIIKNIAKNGTYYSCEEGGGYYPIQCDTPEDTYDSCGKGGLISCDKDSNDCPAFFQRDATASDDKVSGGVCFFIAIIILFTCLIGLVSVLQKMLLGMSTRIVYKATDVNGYLAIAIGAALTMLVQSSSITTSTLTPLVGMGALRLEQMFPLTLGANIGTTMTSIMAALVSDEVESIQVALAHLFFNITGILIFYPIPFMRNIPLAAARRLGKATRIWRGFPLVYIAVMFVFVPMLFLGLSFLFEQDVKGYTVLGSFLVILIASIIGYVAYWCKFRDGQAACVSCMEARERRRLALQELPEDMEYLKTRMAAMMEHTGFVDDLDNKDETGDVVKEKEDVAEDEVEA